jgi:hypothetical protein
VFVFCSFFIYAQSEDADGSDPYEGVQEDLQAVADRVRGTAADGDEDSATEAAAVEDAVGEETVADATAAEDVTVAEDAAAEDVTAAEDAAAEDAAAEEARAERKRRWDAFFKGEGANLSTGKRELRRYFELGLLNLDLGVAGLDFSKFMKGSFFDFGNLDVENLSSFTSDIRLFTNPVYFKISVGNAFTLDFFTGAQMNMYVNLPEKTINSLKGLMDFANIDRPTEDEFNNNPPVAAAKLMAYQQKLGNYVKNLDASLTAGVGAFIELGAGFSKTILSDRLWFRAAPSLFFTLLHMKNNSIGLKGDADIVNQKYGLKGTGWMKLYSAWDLDEDVNPFASPGVDLTLEARYALWSVLDLGLNVSHIPIIPSTLTHSKEIDVSSVSMTVDASHDALMNDPESAINFNVPELDDLLKDGPNENKIVLRPVRFDFYTLYKPFKSPIFIVKPSIGATVNSAAGAGLFNWGLGLEFNLPIIFSAYIATGLTEGLWANRAGIALDFRLFAIELGAAIAAPDFVGSFSSKNGLMVALCLKAGF